MRIGKTFRALELASDILRDWNVPPALWSRGQMKAFLVINPSCALCALHVQHSGASVGVCAV